MGSSMLKFGLSNWRIFRSKQYFYFNDITLLIGTNNSGKSCLVDGLKLICHAINKIKNEIDSQRLRPKNEGDYNEYIDNILQAIERIDFLPEFLQYGDFRKLLNRDSMQEGDSTFSFSIFSNAPEFIGGEFEIEFIYQLSEINPFQLDLQRIDLILNDKHLIGKIVPYSTVSYGLSKETKNLYSYIFDFYKLRKLTKSNNRILKLADKVDELLVNLAKRYNKQNITESAINKSLLWNAIEHFKTVERFQKEFKSELPLSEKEVERILSVEKEIEKKYKLEFKDLRHALENWDILRKLPNNLFFEHVPFFYSAKESDSITLTDLIEERRQLLLQKLPNIDIVSFRKIATIIEESIFEYLMNNSTSIFEFCDIHYGLINATYENELTYDHDGISILDIRKEKKLIKTIISKICDKENILTKEELRYYLDLSFIVNLKLTRIDLFEKNKTIDNWSLNTPMSLFSNLPSIPNTYFANYKEKRLSPSYSIQQNQLGLSRELFLLLANRKSITDELSNFINKYIQYFEIGDKLKISYDDKTAAIFFDIEKNGQNYGINVLGYGSTNVLILLLSILSIASINKVSEIIPKLLRGGQSHRNTILILEEPEANLHPALQSKLADLIKDAYSTFNIKFIIETHSEYLVRKLQNLYAKGNMIKVKRNGVNEDIRAVLYYFSKGDSYRIEIRKDGVLSRSFGTGFYDESAKLMLDLLNLN